jgi:hypothetical protein
VTELAARLRAHGLAESTPVVLHANRRVLVTLTPRGALRVHRGFQAAPDEVVAAIARWARPRTRRADRLQAQRILIAWNCHPERSEGANLRRRDRPLPEDAPHLARLHDLWAELNARHFGAILRPVEILLSRRMRRRLGEFRPAPDPSRPSCIVIGHRHLIRDGWVRASDTLLHEMVHQWQAETGRRLSHGREFRDKCAAVGIDGRAIARIGTDVRRYLMPSDHPGAPCREGP